MVTQPVADLGVGPRKPARFEADVGGNGGPQRRIVNGAQDAAILVALITGDDMRELGSRADYRGVKAGLQLERSGMPNLK